ncbi:MAG: ATP-dependent DNA helicase [Gammaproteobacteria bacterium]
MSLAETTVSLLGGDGLFKHNVPGFAPRDGQMELAAAIAAAIESGEHLVAEAGTGIGKTFAYLVPILAGRRRALISTATRTLQDQLFEHDLPLAARALGRPLTVAVLKGRRNYLCRERWLRLSEDWVGAQGLGIAPEALETWARATLTGDLAELPQSGDPAALARLLTVSTDACLGKTCSEYGRCHVYAARRRALEADVAIVNHSLLIADCVLKAEGAGDLLGAAEVVVVDEAHALVETARLNLGESLSLAQLAELANDADRAVAAALGPLPEVEQSVLALAAATRMTIGWIEPGRYAWGEIEERFVPALTAVAEALADLQIRLEALPEAAALALRTSTFAARLQRFTDGGNDEETWFRWAEVRTGNRLSLHLSPLEPGEILSARIEESAASWIFSSATLAIAGRFDGIVRELGLAAPRTLLIGSPFDYARQARLYLPPNLPDVDDPTHTAAVISAAEPLIRAAEGGCFMLFTSHRELERGAAAIHACSLPYPIFIQGEAPRARLLEGFRAAGNGVLCGTASFRAGVDVKGNALVLVVIDRLPFASPADPLLRARLNHCRAGGGNPFADIQLPEAAMALKQGAGRLIRDVGDHGVLMICDSRISSRGYGRIFIDSLLPMPVITDGREAAAFLAAGLPSTSACA